MKTYCIEFERELDGKNVIHVYSETLPTKEEAIRYIEDEGYKFHEGYDEIKDIYEV